MLSKLTIAALCCLAGLMAVNTFGPQDAKDAKKAGDQEAPTAEQMKEMMDKFEQAAKPVEQHKLLQSLVGKWTTVSKCFMPGMPAGDPRGTAEYRSILGGRQIVEEVRGTMPDGKTFEGFFVIGYDTITKEFVSTWTDTMSTGQYQTRGTADATGKVITMTGETRDAMTPDTPRKWRLVMKFVSADEHVVEVHDTMPGSAEPALVMSVTSTRVK